MTKPNIALNIFADDYEGERLYVFNAAAFNAHNASPVGINPWNKRSANDIVNAFKRKLKQKGHKGTFNVRLQLMHKKVGNANDVVKTVDIPLYL